ncbi:hypothetical protein DAPPUDRAFT_102659 [Daphnia pulex]|uniref:C2H2-type domain-containing protein n=1 Tax=Daphnia pulex TaxID=6669 RepID=E9GH29_DAPPU|nr:hypothetical protein DAPPUDRAFT_102659 [Daphnia pulex]|eukprot:EFX81263.1 hypothetical protein DAPPUDRAFT_102659 [Daphnia pulex]
MEPELELEPVERPVPLLADIECRRSNAEFLADGARAAAGNWSSGIGSRAGGGVKVKGLEETPPSTFPKPHRMKDMSVVVSGIFRNPQECSDEMKEFCFSKSLQLSTSNKNRQQLFVEKICSFKLEIMDITINFPSVEIDGVANCFHFAETKYLEAKFICRQPGCSVEFKRSSSQYDHERNVHRTISYSSVKCVMYAENQKTINNHNVRCHGALASISNQRVFEHVAPLEENEQNGDAADSLIQHVSVSMYKANDDSRASSSFTTNKETNVWDDWEPDAIDYSILETSASPVQATLPNRTFDNAVEETSIGRKAIGIDPPIPIVDNHPALINMIPNPQAVSFNSASALPSSSTSNSSNGNHSSTETQSGFTASRQIEIVTKPKTPISVLRLFSVSKDVTFSMLADFVSQCGPLIHIQTEVSERTKTKTTFVELAVKPSVAQEFV